MTISPPALREKIEELPDLPGVYLFRDITGATLYIGKAQSLRQRVRSYFLPSADLDPRIRLMVAQVRDLDFIVVGSEREALALEFTLIQKRRPRFNVRYRDDKSYPYIRIDLREEFPALCIVRQRSVIRDGARYFGPYLSSRNMWDTIRLLRRIFGLCQRAVISKKRRTGCSWNPARGPRPRPCLDYDLGQCLGPCAAKVTSEEYRAAVHQACSFLEGRYESVLQELRARMERASADLRFESAAKLRDQIASLETSLDLQRIVSLDREDTDAIGYSLQEDTGSLAVIQVREGRIINQDRYLFDGVSGAPAAQVVNEFVKLHYQKVAAIPKIVLLPMPIEDAPLLEELLTERRNARVILATPKRGPKKELVDLAMENAAQHLRNTLERLSVEQRRGEQALLDLQEQLSLPTTPFRIEAFDISNVSGRHAVGSMIVFERGQPKPNDYRRFRIRLSEGKPNDYEMMREVLSRRLKAAVSGNVRFERLPDLLLVDGGPGQLAVALRALQELDLNLPLAGLAKEHERIYLPTRSSPLELPSHSRALHLLQRLRDEAHRFALNYHRSLRAKHARESILDHIPGIGEARKQRLLRHFKSLNQLRTASVDDIAAVAGCGKEVAEAVLLHLKETETS